MSILSPRVPGLKQRIARRQRLARWATALVIPTIAATFYLAHWNEWFVLGGVVLLAVEAVAIGAGRRQRCPVCDASLVIGRRGEARFLDTCPECGFVID